jgi:hypothetical protein
VIALRTPAAIPRAVSQKRKHLHARK